MRRLIVILLLIVYPFQVALAMADKCCALTPAGITHHEVAGGSAGFGVQPEQLAAQPDDGPGMGDPHCAACSFGHTACLPAHGVDMPAARHAAARIACPLPFATAAPSCRPERPKWSSAAS
jgi:hypothetical protein